MDIREELKSAGAYPSGPCSAWPKARNETLHAKLLKNHESQPRVKVSAGNMAKGLLKTAGQAVLHGKVPSEVREERYDTCKNCPAFNSDSKRCSECGCFMEAKTWVGGNPDALCPLKKWER